MAVPHLYTKAHKNAIPVSKKFRGFPAGCLLRVGTRGFSLQAAAVWILRLHAAFFFLILCNSFFWGRRGTCTNAAASEAAFLPQF